MRRPDAERASRHALGNVALAREDARGVWTFGWIERRGRIFATGARILRTAPGLTLTAIALIALVIGGNATIYSIVHGILTKGAPGVDATWPVHVELDRTNGARCGPSRSYERYRELATETALARSAAGVQLPARRARHRERHLLRRAPVSSRTTTSRHCACGSNVAACRRPRKAARMQPVSWPSSVTASGRSNSAVSDDVVGRSLTINGRSRRRHRRRAALTFMGRGSASSSTSGCPSRAIRRSCGAVKVSDGRRARRC